MDPTLSIVVPAYNESASLPSLTSEIDDVVRRECALDAELVLVDDGSTDGTWATIQHAGGTAEHVPVRGVRLQANCGKAAALSAGFDAARGELIITLDADGQNDPADIPDLIRTLEGGADAVFGRRADRQDGIEKTLPSRIQTHLGHLTGCEIRDMGCGIAGFWHYVIADITPLYGDRHRYIAADIHRQGYDLCEQDVNHRPREQGESKYGIERLLRGFVDLWYWIVRTRFGDRPMHWLGGLGTLSLGSGLLIGGVSVIQKYAFGVELAPRTPRLVLVAMLVVAGILLFGIGYLAEQLSMLEHRSQPPYRVRETRGIGRDRLPRASMGAVRQDEDRYRGEQPRGEVVDVEV